jgi:hypothetical protein
LRSYDGDFESDGNFAFESDGLLESDGDFESDGAFAFPSKYPSVAAREGDFESVGDFESCLTGFGVMPPNFSGFGGVAAPAGAANAAASTTVTSSLYIWPSLGSGRGHGTPCH